MPRPRLPARAAREGRRSPFAGRRADPAEGRSCPDSVLSASPSSPGLPVGPVAAFPARPVGPMRSRKRRYLCSWIAGTMCQMRGKMSTPACVLPGNQRCRVRRDRRALLGTPFSNAAELAGGEQVAIETELGALVVEAGEGAPGAGLDEDALGAALGPVGGELPAGAEGGACDALEQGKTLDGGVGAQVGGDIEAAQAGAALWERARCRRRRGPARRAPSGSRRSSCAIPG
jgi:hypothetical protein